MLIPVKLLIEKLFNLYVPLPVLVVDDKDVSQFETCPSIVIDGFILRFLDEESDT